MPFETNNRFNNSIFLPMKWKTITTRFLLIISISLVMTSCETDVDLITDWKEITVVYGLLSQLDSVHYLRINKAFLGKNALEIAKIEDSSSYRNSLDVKLEGWSNNQVVQTIYFDTVTITNKDSGLWYNPYMVGYKAHANLNPDLLYKLYIRNRVTGHEVTSQTRLIKPFPVIKPPAGGRLTLFRGFNTPFSWKNGVNARLYEPIVRFHYFEIPQGSSDTIPRFIDLVLSKVTSNNLDGIGEMEVSFSNDSFYEFIRFKLSQDFNGQRLCGQVEFIITAAGNEFDLYTRVNKPSFSIVQEKPEYTNIENGLGLLSSRYKVSRIKRLDPRAEDEIIALGLKFVKNPNL